MLRALLCVLVSSLATAGCFAEAPVGSSTSSDGSEGTTAQTDAGSGDATAAGTDQGDSGTTTSTSASGSGVTSEGTVTGLETTTGDGSDAGSSSDTGTPGPTVCPMFFDAFDDRVEDPLWRQGFATSSAELDGELVITVTGELNDEFVTMLVLPEQGGLQGGTLRLELGTIPADVGVRTTLWVRPTEGDGRISFSLVDRGNGLRLEARITPEVGSPNVVAALNWEPALMSWLQLREADGQLYFEYSPDGVTFEVFHDMQTPFDVDSAEVGFAGHNDLELPNEVQVSVRTFEFICGA